MPAPQTVLTLIENFERNLDAYRSGKYNETQVRRDFNMMAGASGHRSHAPRGNAACAAPAARDAERPSIRYHAERGNDEGRSVGMRPVTLCVTSPGSNRHGP
ncbi:MAG: hypothetical protein NUV75_05895 [Gallionella sp.]|nr:hypothetical protein [Gallionella sp.]